MLTRPSNAVASGSGRAGKNANMPPTTFLTPPPLAFAHQGGGREHTENSWEAFESTVALGFGYLETDIHTSSDGVAFCLHDDTLDRTTNGTGPAKEQPWAAIAALRVDGSERPPPRLDEVLARWPDLRLNVDPKLDEAVAPLVKALREADAVSRVCVGSFADRRIKRVVAALGAQLVHSTGPFTTVRWVAGSLLPTALGRLVARTSAACYQVPVKQWFIPVVTGRTVRLAHAMGKQVHVWVVDATAEMERLLDLGVDGLMTDRPTALRDVLEARGQWPPRA